MFLPTTRKELGQLGWDQLDIILVTGDSYIDSPFKQVADTTPYDRMIVSQYDADRAHTNTVSNLSE